MPTHVCVGHVGGLPTPEPWVFTGDPLQYPVWRIAFDTLIEHSTTGDSAKEAVEGHFLLTTDTSFKERYGNQFLIADAFRNRLAAWPKIASREGVGT